MNQSSTHNCWALLEPSKLSLPYSWVGHTPFAMWLICKLNPTSFVELGTHSGNSYFAFCESVKFHQLQTQCFAIDTWEGDPHAEFYDTEVFDLVNQHNAECYSEFSELLQMTFDDALQKFESNSVDLLHIDGLHTYEAVKHDFDTWLDKVTADGVILFHDISVRERDFGVYKLWEEIKSQYPYTIEFDHSYGLGVVFLQKPKDPELLALTDKNLISPLHHRFETLGIQKNFHVNLQDLESILQNNLGEKSYLVKEFDTLVHKHNQLIEEKATKSALEQKHNQLIEEKLNQLESLNNQLLGSTSWRLTSPLRKTMIAIKKIPKLFCRSKTFVKTSIHLLRTHGVKAFLQKLNASIKKNGIIAALKNTPAIESNQEYRSWSKVDLKNRMLAVEQYRKTVLTSKSPLISIIMPVYNSDLSFLEEAIESVKQQVYLNWELCICNDASTHDNIKPFLDKLVDSDSRIKVCHLDKNSHISIASNQAIKLAKGEFLALMDHDDLLSPDALFWVTKTIQDHPDAQLIYSDEDKIDLSGQLLDPYFKGNWNLELALGQNFFSHLGVYSRKLVNQVGGFREGYEGAQDYDLMLRCALVAGFENIVHIPKVLYHWRMIPGSTAINIEEKPYALDAAQKAITEFAQQQGLRGKASTFRSGLYRFVAEPVKPEPSVTIIIPTHNGYNLLKNCVDSLLTKTTYQNFEIIIVDNRSDEHKTLQYLRHLQTTHANIRVIEDNRPFNYSQLNNTAITKSSSDFVLLLNNDTEVISPDWLEEMVSIAMRKGVGAVGAKLLYPDNKLQHGGVIMGLGGVAGHAHNFIDQNDSGYFGLALLPRAMSAVTGACLLVERAKYLEVGGLNETDLKVAFNDVDLCLKLMEAGYRNVWTPFAKLYHHESVSRGKDDTPEKMDRFQQEIRYMNAHWSEFIKRDPNYNPNLDLTIPFKLCDEKNISTLYL